MCEALGSNASAAINKQTNRSLKIFLKDASKIKLKKQKQKQYTQKGLAE
jgi:hypothetical protein